MARSAVALSGVLAMMVVLAACGAERSAPAIARPSAGVSSAMASPAQSTGASAEAVSATAPASSTAVGSTLYVSTTGSDDNAGTSVQAPLASIQTAVARSRPGDTVRLTPGVYFQDVRSAADGTAAAPITITGPTDAVVKGGGKINIFEITHDYIVLEGFTIDGMWEPPSSADSFRRKLIYARAVHGLRVLRMTLTNAGSACLRLQEDITDAEVAFTIITNCGWIDFKYDGGGVNGEGIYVGTSLNHSGGTASDNSRQNWIHRNTIDTQGSECIDVKPGSSHNLIEHNRCTGSQKAGIAVAGDRNVLRANEISGVRDAAIILRGVDNEIYDNYIHDNADGIHFYAAQQLKICCNTMENTGRLAIGSSAYDPTGPGD